MHFLFDKNFYFVVFASLGFFSAITTPSIKLVYSSELVNVIPLVLLMVSVVFATKDRLKLGKIKSGLAFSWLLFSICILLFFFLGDSIIDQASLGKYLYFICIVFLLIFASCYEVMEKVTVMVIVWALVLSTWQILIGIQTDRSLGQHYLTVSMPIAAGLSGSLAIFLMARITLFARIVLGIISFILVYALSTLLGRSSVLFPFLIIFTFLFLSVFLSKGYGVSRRIAYLFFLASAVSVALLMIQSFESKLLNRIRALSDNIESEPRVEIYSRAFDLILNSPILGYGTNSSRALFDNYPHNIFLEVFLHGGIVLFLPFFFIIYSYGKAVVNSLSISNKDCYSLGGAAISFLFFLQWNTSFSISSAYIPLGVMILSIVAQDEMRKARGIG